MVHGDGWVDHVASQRSETRKRAVLIRAGQPAEPDDISRQDRRYLALAMF
jgi:3-methyladenine DNA glycosylase Mpg